MGNQIIKRVVIPFDEKKFVNGQNYLDRQTDDFVGVMVNGQAVFISRDKIKNMEVADTSISMDLPLWYVEHKSLEIFIDTSDEPTLF